MTVEPTPRFSLCDAPPLLIEGADAHAFLNRLLTVNVRSFGEGEGRPAHLLSATGRLSASLFLSHLSDGRWLAIPRTLSASELRDKLDMYLFAEDVKLSSPTWRGLRLICHPRSLAVLSDALGISSELELHPVEGAEGGWRVLYDQPEEQGTLLQADRWARGSELIELEWWGEPERRGELVTSICAQGASALTQEEAEALRLRLGAPDRPEYQEHYTPLDVEGSSPLLSVSEGKGCYPGQEVIERTLALGQPARQLAHLCVVSEDPAHLLVSTLGSTSLDVTLYSAPNLEVEVGSLTSISPVFSDQERYGLAMIKRKQAHLAELFTADGARLRVLSRHATRSEGEGRDER